MLFCVDVSSQISVDERVEWWSCPDFYGPSDFFDQVVCLLVDAKGQTMVRLSVDAPGISYLNNACSSQIIITRLLILRLNP